MPFTPSHAAVVLPLARLGLPTAALVIGSMVPDVPLFLHRQDGYRLTHSWAGVVGVDLLGTLVLLGLWTFLLRDALVDLAPAYVRERLPARARLGRREWLLAPVAAVVGSISHVMWDAFTHGDRWGVAHVAWLQARHGPLPGHKWAQYVSGVVGLAVVVAAALAHLRSQPVHPVVRRRLPALVLPGLALVAASYGVGVMLARLDEGLHAVVYAGVVHGIAAGAVGTVAAGVTWNVFLAVTSGNRARTRRT